MATKKTSYSGFPSAGEWPCYRRDGTQQARSPLKGNIKAPKVRWRHFVGAIDTLVECKPGTQEGAVTIPLKTSENSAEAILEDPRWGLQPPLEMIEGRKQPAIRTMFVTYANLLRDRPGLEKIEFESPFFKPTTDGAWAPAGAKAMAWSGKTWETLWTMPPMDWLFIALPLVDDFDGDGKLEIAFLPWRKLVILDALTGKVKDECHFVEAEAGCGRCYGFFGAYDLDADGKKEFVVLSDFSKHIDVLGYRDGKLSLLWRQDIEVDIFGTQKILRVHPDPVADVDGDGKLEILVSLYNGTGDGKWHTMVYDGMTGRVKADIPDERLKGILDVDGDGTPEFLTVVTDGRSIPEFGTVRIRTLKEGRPKTLWERKSAGWQICDRPLPLHVNSSAMEGRQDVLWRIVGEEPVIVLRSPASNGGVTLSVESWRGNGLEPIMTVTGEEIEAIALDESGAMLVSCQTNPGSKANLAIKSGEGTPLLSRKKGTRLSSPVVVQDKSSAGPVIVARGSGEQLVAFLAPAGGEPTRELWRIRGRDQAEGISAGRTLGPAMADLMGDGRRQLIYTTAAPSGCGRLVAMALDGKEVWHHDVDYVPGKAPTQNVGGVFFWQVGHFTDKKQLDVLLTVRRSMMHSEETMLLGGKDGRRIWLRDRQVLDPVTFGVGGTPFAIADFDGDGLDDAALLFPNIYYILKGASGENVLAKWVTNDEVPGSKQWGIYWGVPVAVDTGKTDIFFGTKQTSLTALLTIDGKFVWWDARDTSPKALPAFGNFTGSGRLEAVGVGYPDGLRCYDVATGEVKWRLPLAKAGETLETASADVDSDGRDEALFVIEKSLYCAGADEAGKTGIIKWKLDFPVDVGAPVIADVDGSGQASILLTGNDGYVYCIAQS